MKKISEKSKEQEKTDKEIIIEKIRQRNTIIIAVLGLIGTALTAYFGYLSNRQSATNAIPVPSISLTLSTGLTQSSRAAPAPAAAPLLPSSPPYVRDTDT